MWRMGLLLGLSLVGVCLAADGPANGLRTTVLKNGLKIAYRAAGREEGKPVVFLHGYSLSSACNVPPKGLGEPVRQRMAAYGDREANRAVFRQSMARYFDAGNLAPGELDAFVEIGLQAGSQVAVVPRSGHSPMWEKPAEYAALLAAFLEDLP